MSNHTPEKFPWTHVFGFVLSLVLTFATLAVALHSNLSTSAILWLIVGLAFLQAFLQLFMFMHMTEGESGKLQTVNIFYGIFVAIVVVIGSIWTMSF